MGAIERVFRGRRGGQERPAAAIVAGLWRNGEQGFWYDDQDLSTMYQDYAGTTPVYMPGQGQVDPPVGLQLDKRLGLVRGPERVINGDFSAGATGWILANADATHIATFAGGTLRYQSDTMSPQLVVAQLSALVIGRWYEVTFVVSAWVSGTIKAEGISVIPPVSGVGTYTHRGAALASTLSITRSSANVDITIDSISVKELPGNHRFQASTPSRPTLSGRYNLITYSEQFDAAAWTKVECSVVPNVVVGPNGGLADKLIPGTAANQHHITCTAGTATESRTAYVVAKADGCSNVTLWPGASATFAHFNLTAGTTSKEASVISTSITPLGDGWYVLRATWAVLSLTHLRIYTSSGSFGSVAVAGDGVAGILVERADIRAANDSVGLPSYQRVVDPNTYDTVGFPLRLKWDGIDDWMQTAAVDLTGTDKVVFASAARKSTDVNCIFMEFGTGFGGEGMFGFQYPNASGAFLSAWGTGASVYRTAPLPGAPESSVLISVLDRSKATASESLTVWVDGVQTSGPSIGTPVPGVFGTNPFYFGRRGGTALPFSGFTVGSIFVGRALSAAEVSAVARYLNSKARAY